MTAYYNEIDPYAAQWLRNLIAAGLIAPGDVDTRSIVDVVPSDLAGYTQCHFFAGIGGWSYAARLAGWPDDRPLWTGSCPCQPFSSAGKRRGVADERHLWPMFRGLIAECSPTVIIGEQVASQDGRIWLAGVRSDLEALGYAVGAADLCAAGVSAPHIRQRLYWLGHTDSDGCQARNFATQAMGYGRAIDATNRPHPSRMVNANGHHIQWWSGPVQVGWNGCEATVTRGGREYRAQWRLKPGLSIVAHGVSGRVGQICGAGNAIVPQVAAEFIGAFLDAERVRLTVDLGAFA